MRMVSSCRHSEIEGCENMGMTSSYRHSEIEDYETVRMVSSHRFPSSKDYTTVRHGLAIPILGSHQDQSVLKIHLGQGKKIGLDQK